MYSGIETDHVEHLNKVFKFLHQHSHFIKIRKCSFAIHRVEYLGHINSGEGVSTDPKKINTIKRWAVPTIAKQLSGFLGLASYYRRFIKDYAVLSHPLKWLLKKNVKFKWFESA